MPWIRFTDKFDWRPPGMPHVIVAFKPGVTCFVTRHCANAVQRVGRGLPVTKPLQGDPGAALAPVRQPAPRPRPKRAARSPWIALGQAQGQPKPPSSGAA